MTVAAAQALLPPDVEVVASGLDCRVARRGSVGEGGLAPGVGRRHGVRGRGMRRLRAVGTGHADRAHHARNVMVEQVAVDQPVSLALVGRELDRPHAHRGDVDRVLQRGGRWVLVGCVHQAEEVAVEMDRVMHHAVVHQAQPDRLAFLDLDRLGLAGVEPVEAPLVADHVACQLERQLPVGGGDGVGLGGAQLGVGRDRSLRFLGAGLGVDLVEDGGQVGAHAIAVRLGRRGRLMR